MPQQQAAMALRKAFPNERSYDFWNILLCFLVQRDERTSDKERLLFGTLAYRLISKAAESIPTTMVGLRQLRECSAFWLTASRKALQILVKASQSPRKSPFWFRYIWQRRIAKKPWICLPGRL